MKLIITIVSRDDASAVMRELVKNKFFVTKLASSGGFLRSGNTTLMIGTSDENVDKAINLITENSKNRKELVPNSIVSDFGMFSSSPIEVTVGGATMFVVNVEKIVKVWVGFYPTLFSFDNFLDFLWNIEIIIALII